MMLLLHCVDTVVVSYGCYCCIVLILLYRMDVVVASCWYCCCIVWMLLLHRVDTIVVSNGCCFCIVWMLLLHRRTSDDDMKIAKILEMPDDLMWICLSTDDENMMRTWCCWRPCVVEDLMLMRTWLWRIPSLLRGSVEFWVASESILRVFHIFMMYYCTFHIYYSSGNHVRILHMIYPRKKSCITQSKLVGQPSVFWGLF